MKDVKFVKWSERDIENLVLLANNSKIAGNLRDVFPNPYTNADAIRWISMQKNVEPAQNFSIRIDGELVGAIGCHPLPDVNRKCFEIGYWIAEEWWNKGIATAAVKKMTEYVFSHFDVIRLQAPVFEKNKASMRVLEKAGFHLEAIHKKAVIKNNILMDEYLYVKFKSEW